MTYLYIIQGFNSLIYKDYVSILYTGEQQTLPCFPPIGVSEGIQQEEKMILCDREIKKLCTNHNMVEPFEEKLLNSNSIDIRCGLELKLLTSAGFFAPVNLEGYTSNKPYYLQPKDRILLSSLEIFNLPDNVCGEFKLKSSRGREFYQAINSGFIDAGYTGSCLTMQLLNLSYGELKIFPGFPIGQIIFHSSNTPDKSYKERGRYNYTKSSAESKG